MAERTQAVEDKRRQLLDAAVRKAAPRLALELGTYCGYSALRIVRELPAEGRLISIEFNPANADIARRIWQQAGIADRPLQPLRPRGHLHANSG